MDTPAVDVIRLENFAATMPRWDPGSLNQRYAVVDMGSNGIRFSITCLAPPRSRLLRCLYRERAPISLFDALASSPGFRFSDQVIASVAEALARFLNIATAHGVPFKHISIFATEAMRKANNAVDMLESIHRKTGLKVHVLDGMVETLFGAAGARSAFSRLRGLVLDLGGGSVQMTWMDSTGGSDHPQGLVTGDDERRVRMAGRDSLELEGYEVAAARAGRSMPFGAARMTRLLESADGELIQLTRSDLRNQMKESFNTLTREFPELKAMVDRSTRSGRYEDGLDIYLCGGGFRGYGSMLLHSESLGDTPYPISSIGSYRAEGEAFSDTKKMNDIHVKTGDAKIFGLSKRRRRQFPAIVEVVEALLASVNPAKIRSATFCAGSNREGALFMMLPREVRESNPLPLLAPKFSSEDIATTEAVIDLLHSAIPEDLIPIGTPTMFSLGLVATFVQTMWSRPGGDPDCNAAALLHEAIAGNDVAGMTHQARAVIAITGAGRWGAVRAKDLGPVEKQLWKGLRKVLGDEAIFWCSYVGTVAMCLCTVIPAWPRSPPRSVLSFDVYVDRGKKNNKIQLSMNISKASAVGLGLEGLREAFDKVKLEDPTSGRETKVKFSVHLV